ncbi:MULTISPECIES: hypothetical protein [unclassified Planococcus (in: firmicutes)]|uniref:hypothetical protein n=1 Tax=unclassified Planococcus (in: firmicutes) TaxID=2662419 RepID=UPI000C7B27B7|nr:MULTISPECIES: hypothetical protein [unclassified Planococcus (in: firmicutes)]PKG44745.1 hypothetical protein CXF66_16145 [Planococcus sp. Urea-trap-24]PKG87088.1 hypothetical protein CXF91_13815 [Planococcus sp. Urea-3u-39]PKH41143.1 hypothetical protein CXF77_06970 [Planococcus sp. MB-3u-09]
MTHKKRKRLIIGVLLLVISLPSITPMLMEMAYRMEMNIRYDIKELNAIRTDYAGAPDDANYNRNIIRASHVTTGEPYFNAWDSLVHPSDIRITVNGETVETLEDYPVQLLEYEELAVEGLDRYNGTITYWTVEDKFTDKDFFGIVIFQNGYDMRFHRDGEVMPGYVSTEDREFKLISIQKDGTVSEESFTFENKSKLQTQLITEDFSGPINYYLPPGYYYPSLLYPLLYPWITSIVGLALILFNFPYGAMKKRSAAKNAQ